MRRTPTKTGRKVFSKGLTDLIFICILAEAKVCRNRNKKVISEEKGRTVGAVGLS